MYKIIGIVFSFIATIATFLMPVIIAASVVAVPVLAIHEIFSDIGDSMVNSENQVIELIDLYLKQDESKEIIKNNYEPLLLNNDKNISLNWLVIPNLLAGIERVDSNLIQSQIDIISKNDLTLEEYIDLLRTLEPWKSAYGNISTSTIAMYINKYNSYLGQEGNIDVGDLAEEEFLYPLRTRAIVTSEFGQRFPVTLPNGQIVDSPHTGIDLAYNGGDKTTCGVPIYASMPGEVVATDKTINQAGAYWGGIKFKNLEIRYLHLRDPFPHKVGDTIAKGEFIGYIGNSGLSTACHLHYETYVNDKAINPRNFLDF